jgi:hypothetical protein
MDQPPSIADDLRSHVSHFSAVGAKMGKPRYNKRKKFYEPFNFNFETAHYIRFRSIADGQSHHSFSNQSHRGYLNSGFPTNLVSSRPGRSSQQNEHFDYFSNRLHCEPELRQSRTSLAAASERMSRASYAGSFHGGPQSIASSTRRARPRSRSREQLSTAHLHSNRPGSRWWWIFMTAPSKE